MQNTKSELLPSLAGLPKALTAELDAIGRTRKFRAGQTVAFAGTQPEFIGFIRRGILRMVHPEEDGRAVVVGLLGEGDMFGRLPYGVLRYDKEAATGVEISAFPRGRFEALALEWPELEHLLASKLANELDHAREWMVLLLKQTARERLGALLVMLCCRWNHMGDVFRIENGKPVIHVPISRADLASFLGMQPETVSRAFHALDTEGVIAIRTPRDFEIVKFDALADLAGARDLIDTKRLEGVRSRLR